MARPIGDGYLRIVAALANGPLGRAELSAALGNNPQFDGQNVTVLMRHCKPSVIAGKKVPTMFIEIPPDKSRPHSRTNFTRWRLSAAGQRVADALAEEQPK